MKLARDLIIPYQASEAPWSYCSRIAHYVGVGARAFARHAGTSLRRIVYGEDDALCRLADATETDINLLRKNAPTMITRGRYLLRGEVLTAPMLGRNKIRYCPICLKEQAAGGESALHLPSEWIVSPITVCPRHNVGLHSLVDFGPSAWDTLPLLKYALKTADKRPVIQRYPTAFERHLIARMDMTPDDSWLSKIPLYAVVDLSIAVGTSQRFDVHQSWTSLDPTETHEAACLGFEICEAGEEAIREYLAVRDFMVRHRRGQIGPLAIYGKLYDFLTRRADDRSYDYFRNVMEDHILEKVTFGDKLFGKTVEVRRMHSLLSLKKSSGLSTKKLRNVLLNEGVIDYQPKGSATGQFLIPAGQAETIIALNADGCSLRQLVSVLGSTERQAKAMVQSGLIPAVAKRGKMRCFSRKHANSLRLQMVIRGKSSLAHQCGLKPIGSRSLRVVATELQIIELLLTGKLNEVGLADDTGSLVSLLVSKDEIRQVLERESIGLTGEEVKKRLRLLDGVWQHLCHLGILAKPSVPNPTGKVPTMLTAVLDVERFEKTYILLGTLALKVEMHPVRVYRQLEAAKIEPVVRQAVARATVYLKSEVAALYPEIQ